MWSLMWNLMNEMLNCFFFQQCKRTVITRFVSGPEQVIIMNYVITDSNWIDISLTRNTNIKQRRWHFSINDEISANEQKNDNKMRECFHDRMLS